MCTPRAMSKFHPDAGSGSMLTLGIGASFLILAILLIPLLGGFVIHQRLQGVADIAALAAADTASGLQPGNPCKNAENISARATFTVQECRLDGLISRVTVMTVFGPFELVAQARAGPSSAT
jgi:secretion/DNA translocation related TadE-like protein